MSSSTTTSPPSSHFSLSLQNLGLGYAIALAFGFLVLFSALLLSSYLCCRRRNHSHHHRHHNHHQRHQSSSDANAIIVPRIFFVAEDDDADDLENHNSSSSNGVVGLDRAVINSYPKFHFYKKNFENNSATATASVTDNLMMCSICLCDYKDAEMLRMMPDCKHFFHLTCLDAWLKLNGSCPVCRNSPLPTPVSTPLAEVVPLSHYPNNRRTSTVVSSS